MRDGRDWRSSGTAAGESLGSIPLAKWGKIREELPTLLREIGERIDPTALVHLPPDAAPELVVAYLHRDGAVIVDRAVSEDTADATLREMHPYVEDTPFGRDSFVGNATKRTGALVARSKSSWSMVAHPLLMDVCEGVLGQQLMHLDRPAATGLAPGYKRHPWQCHLTQIIQVPSSCAAMHV